MIKTSTRRTALVLALGTSTFASIGVARAQTTGGITGTDPVPKGCGCVVSQPAPSAASVSKTQTVTQAMLVFLGLA